MSLSGEETVAGLEFALGGAGEIEALRAARDAAEGIVAHLPVPLLVLDEHLLVHRGNLAFQRRYGLALDQLLGRSLFECGGGEWNIPMLRALLENVVRQGASVEDVALRHTFADGETRLLLLNARRLTDGAGELRILLTVRDITERSRAEEALRQGAEQFAAIFNQSTSGIVQLDLGGRFVLANDHFAQIAGRSREELLKLRLRDLLHPEDQAPMLERFLELAAGECTQFVIEQRLLRPADGEVWVRSDVSGIRDPSGRVHWVAAVVTDMTEVRAREADLRAAAEELAQADRSKDEFLAMLAHELRNPLAPVRSAAELLSLPEVASDDREEALAILKRQIENMSRMIDDLLDVARITEGKIALRRDEVDLCEIVAAAVSAIRPACRERDQELAVSLPQEPVLLLADSTRLEQVLGNLLGNACKYSGSESRIEVGLRVSRTAEPPEAELWVRDNGPGIAPDLLPRIFDLFVQASRALDRAHGGLGIGLTLVDRLVRLHGGSVEARSAGLGQGSEFVVRLPVLTRPSAPSAPTPPKTAKPVLARRLLVVDDNADSAQGMALLQRARGHQVRTALDGPSALAAAAEFEPDFVLLDIGLPGMDGFEVARRLRSAQPVGGPRIVAMSGYRSDEDRARAAEAGFDEYLVKPVDLERLRGLLAE